MVNEMGRKIENGTPVVDFIVLHHTAGDEGKNYYDSAIRKSLNAVGFSRGYADKDKGQYDYATGYSKSTGRTNRKKLVGGGIGYAEYHFAIHAYDLDRASPYYEKGGFRLVPLLEDPLLCDAGSTGNLDVNSRAIAICFCGNYEEHNIPEFMIEWFINKLRPGHELNFILRHNQELKIIGHKDIDKTACPGKYLYTYIPRIDREVRAI